MRLRTLAIALLALAMVSTAARAADLTYATISQNLAKFKTFSHQNKHYFLVIKREDNENNFLQFTYDYLDQIHKGDKGLVLDFPTLGERNMYRDKVIAFAQANKLRYVEYDDGLGSKRPMLRVLFKNDQRQTAAQIKALALSLFGPQTQNYSFAVTK